MTGCAWQHFENLESDRWHVGDEQNARSVSDSLEDLGEDGAAGHSIYHPNRSGCRRFELDCGFNWIAAWSAAALNFGLNLWLIPRYGMLGAAYATLAAFLLLMAIRTVSAQKIYPVAYQWRRVGELLLVAGGLTLGGELLPRSLPLAFGLTLAYPLALGLLGFYLPAERQRLRRLLPAHN